MILAKEKTIARDLAATLLLTGSVLTHNIAFAQSADALVLLVPDQTSTSDPYVRTWTDAALEEGLHITALQDSQFIQLGTNSTKYRGLILPDSIHTKMSDALITAIDSYAKRGGNVLLSYDAGALTSDGFYAFGKSRLSALAGVDYVLYDELRDQTVGLGPVFGAESTLWNLQVPPGKYMADATNFAAAAPLYLQSSTTNPGGLRGYQHSKSIVAPESTTTRSENLTNELRRSKSVITGTRVLRNKYPLTSTRTKSSEDLGARTTLATSPLLSSAAVTAAIQPSSTVYGISGYVYGLLTYPSFVTRGDFAGTVLLNSPTSGLVAGQRAYGTGQVLFANLPLGYLKAYGTDGMLMHGLLHHFATNMLGLPYLANHPKGQAGLVLNWHVDSAPAIPAIAALDSLNVWSRGKFSIDMTAGPDTIVPGDGLGINLPNNSAAQNWLRYFVSKGHQVGSHGGWIHDYYGFNANETNQAEFQNYLVLNKRAIENVIGRPVIEYSAPMGNNPQWALDWLAQNGVVGYYLAGNTGLGPTRAYSNGQNRNPSMWAFPVTPFGKYATLEEFQEYGVSDADVTRWLSALTDFAINNHTSRLVYFHPPGAQESPSVVDNLLTRTASYASTGKFTWYTMVDLANFNASRSKLTWQVAQTSSSTITVTGSHPSDLKNQTWLVPKTKYKKPVITSGSATINQDANSWIVAANSGRTLKFTASKL